MKRFFRLFRYQTAQMLISSSTYIAAFLFLSFMGVMYIYSVAWLSVTQSRISLTEIYLSIFWVPVLFMVPMLTMRSLAEERRQGTLAALMTTPVKAWQIVLSKFAACYLFYALLWLATLVFPLIAYLYVPATAAVFDVRQAACGYAFILLSGAAYVAIGLFASSLTRTTLVAGMLSFCMLFLVIVGGGIIAKMPMADAEDFAAAAQTLDYFQTFRHFEDFLACLVDTRPFFLYLSTAAVLIAVTSLVTEAKNA